MAAVLPIRPDDRDIIATEARNIAASMRVIEAIAGFGTATVLLRLYDALHMQEAA